MDPITLLLLLGGGAAATYAIVKSNKPDADPSAGMDGPQIVPSGGGMGGMGSAPDSPVRGRRHEKTDMGKRAKPADKGPPTDHKPHVKAPNKFLDKAVKPTKGKTFGSGFNGDPRTRKSTVTPPLSTFTRGFAGPTPTFTNKPLSPQARTVVGGVKPIPRTVTTGASSFGGGGGFTTKKSMTTTPSTSQTRSGRGHF